MADTAHRTDHSSPATRKRKRHEDSSDRPHSVEKGGRKKKSSTAGTSQKDIGEMRSSSKTDSEARAVGNGFSQRSSPEKGAEEPTAFAMEDKFDGRKKKESGGSMANGSDKQTRKHEARGMPSKENDSRRKVISAADGDDATMKRHKKIMSKYEKAKKSAADLVLPDLKENQPPVEDDEKEAHGLVPLPQPAPAPSESATPSYSTLPTWLAAPSKTSSGLRSSFSSLGVGTGLVDVLKNKGYTEALPVQSAVIPLLAKGPARYTGDVCVSAATGSGKTLAYVLPIFAGLKRLPVAKLRALIIVPTRELVKQVRDACELCSSGSGLRIGTAVGSTALKDEQAQIMEQISVYRPESTRSQNGTIMMADEWASFSLVDYIAEAEEYSKTLPDHCIESSPCVDVLICTPGRLVDHIRSTKGFTLGSLEWLVIDEADRLLNESFQEWVETVLPALETKEKPAATGSLEELIKAFSHPAESRKLQKVILSATMTRDITKLNSLRLHNPKLVVVDGAERDEAEVGEAEPDSNIALPSLLNESSIPVGDGSEKPLYLLKLLQSYIGMVIEEKTRTKSRRISVSSDTSVSSSDSSDSSDDSISSSSASSSTSTSEDDSDSSSDSNSSVSSDSSTSDEQNNTSGSVLIFTKSSEAASRLSRLLTLMYPYLDGKVGTLIKSNKSSTSRRAISAYRKGKIQIIIATDRASRGLDLPLLDNVINYDVPNSLTTYVHRVGRTARAGRPGSAWTLVTHSEGRWFTNDIARGSVARAAGKTVKRVSIKLDVGDISDLEERYARALKQLEAEVAGLRKGVGKDSPVKAAP
ncbi:ATP-dependent RNA helicase [Trichophyton interdigitale]|uniref:RNA helicase n=1 Tax=Trichophyton interdigitale TaxID=101480 RepID=A0A9P5CWQ4_9EURO|nr:ATP-dependent RNA helicase [Trichophyton interdigitale]KAF3894768.1 ATP-dependent RNA helicase [Trichophyton interdigitale]KAG8209619.1 ATP-dependent RNA helicase [Trichophyton interdigitale]